MIGKVCILCLKSFQSVHNELPPGEYCGVPLLTKFLKFTQNYLELPLSPTIQQLITSASDNHDDTSRDTFCEKCELAVINPICKVYLELISAQLRLSWELEHLEKLLENSKRDVPTKSGAENMKLLTEQLGIEKVSDLKDFRNLLAQKCQLKRKMVLPQVIIGTRCDAQESHFLENDALYDDSEQVLEDPLAFDEAAPDPLDFQCGVTSESNAEENFVHEKVIKLEEFQVANEQELIPEIEVEAPVNLPSTSNSILLTLLNTSPAPKDNFLSGEYECPTCGKILRSNAVFEVHDRYYHKSINCTLCRKTFTGNKNLRGHIRRVHTHKLSFPCRVCAKVFPSTSALSIHTRSYHKPNQLQFRCSHTNCTASFLRKTNLKQHVAAIHKPGIFFCPHCPGRVFSTKKYLGVHVRKLHGSMQPQPLQLFVDPS